MYGCFFPFCFFFFTLSFLPMHPFTYQTNPYTTAHFPPLLNHLSLHLILSFSLPLTGEADLSQVVQIVSAVSRISSDPNLAEALKAALQAFDQDGADFITVTSLSHVWETWSIPGLLPSFLISLLVSGEMMVDLGDICIWTFRAYIHTYTILLRQVLTTMGERMTRADVDEIFRQAEV